MAANPAILLSYRQKGNNHPMIQGKIISINISEEKGTIKSPVSSAQFKCSYGIVGDAHAGNWHRQVSLLAMESIHQMAAMGIDGLVPGQFAENLTTEGICLYELPVGTRLQIGETIQEVTQIGKECHQGCAIKQKTGTCIMPTQGIFTKVIREGTVHIGDTITVL
jgi:MOSC domain-containing protein YiiM